MKKFLLSLAVTMTAVCGAFAQTVISASQIDLTAAKNIDGFTVEVLKNNGANSPTLNNGETLRLYADNTLSVSGTKITKIVVAINATTNAKRYTTFTPNVGSYTTNQAVGDEEITWEGDAVSVVFTVGSQATLGSESTKAGQIHITKITVYGEGGSSVTPVDPDPVTPDPIETVGDGTEAKPYTVADVIALNNTKSAAAWVKGYIVGSSNGGGALTLTPANDTQSPSNILIADKADETNIDAIIAVQLVNKTDIRAALNLVDNPGNLGKVLEIKGDLEKYFGDHPGVKSPSAYKLDGQGSTPVDPTPDPEIPTTGPGSADQPYTIAEAIAIDNNKSKGWVNGYIVGVMHYNEEEKANYFSSEVNGMGTNIVIAATTTETNTENMICVQLPAGKIREDLNLVDRPGNMGKEVSVCGSFEKYCGIHGVKNTSDYTIVGGIAPIPVTETASLTTFVEEQNEDSNMKITGTVTVFYQSPDKQYTFITDGESNLEIYGVLPEYHNGDQLTGIVGKYKVYNNMPEMIPQADSFGAATAGTPVEPTEVAFNQINIAQYVKVLSIDIYAEEVDGKTNYYFGQDDAKRQIFDRFNIGGIKEGICTITGIGAIYNDTAQIFPTELEYKVASIEEITTTGAKAEIFDLQGRKVVNPAKGMYIVNGKKTVIR